MIRIGSIVLRVDDLQRQTEFLLDFWVRSDRFLGFTGEGDPDAGDVHHHGDGAAGE